MRRKNKKLLYISSSMRFPSEKAHSYQILQMCEAFADSGLSVTLLLPKRKNNQAMNNIRDPFKYYGIKQNFHLMKLKSIDLLWLAILNKLTFSLQKCTFLFSLKKYLNKNLDCFDVIFTRDISVVFSLPKAYFEKEVFLELHSLNFGSKKKLTSYLQKYFNIKVVVLTKIMKKELRQFGIKNKIIVAPDAVDLKKYRAIPKVKQLKLKKKLKIGLNKTVFGYIGRFNTMNMEKGIPEIIQSIKYISRSYRDKVLFLFVGGPMSQVVKYKSLMAKEGVAKALIRFVDHVPPKQVNDYLSIIDVALMPFPRNEHYEKYMSPMKMFEYMVTKKTIIATRLKSITEILNDDNSFLIKPSSSKAIGDTINKILSNKKTAKIKSEKAFRNISKYTWENRVKQIFQ